MCIRLQQNDHNNFQASRFVFNNKVSFNIWQKIIGSFLIIFLPVVIFLGTEALSDDTPDNTEQIMFYIRSVLLVIVLILTFFACGFGSSTHWFTIRYGQAGLGFTRDDILEIRKYLFLPVLILFVTLILWTFGEGKNMTVTVAGENQPAVVIPLLILLSLFCRSYYFLHFVIF